MENQTYTIKTPVTEISIEMHQWITGRKAEYIQEPILSAVKLGNNSIATGDISINSIDTSTAIRESNHREIESYIFKVEEETDPKKFLETILDLPEEDYLFIQEEIAKIKANGKKKS